MKILWHSKYAHPLPDKHKFPMSKYDLLPINLLNQNIITKQDIVIPEKANKNDILLAHTKEYIDTLINGTISPQILRRIGFPYSQELIERELLIMQGTILAAELSFANGVCFNIAGGTHHAFSNKGEGFCIFNDLAITALAMISRGLAQKVLIVDLDVHQGNGTAEICANHPNIFAFSMHGRDNYPLQKEISSLDVELENGIKDKEYLAILADNLFKIENIFKPDLILYQAGVDILETDKFGRMNISIGGCQTRDELVFQFAKDKKLPIAVTMGGGYSPKIETIIEAHTNTFKVAKQIF